MLIFAYKHDIIACFLLLNVLKDTMEDLESMDKATCTKEMLPNTHFDKMG